MDAITVKFFLFEEWKCPIYPNIRCGRSARIPQTLLILRCVGLIWQGFLWFLGSFQAIQPLLQSKYERSNFDKCFCVNHPIFRKTRFVCRCKKYVNAVSGKERRNNFSLTQGTVLL